MNRLGSFEVHSVKKTREIKLKDLKSGINDLNNYIIKINQDNSIDYIIDKICDHAGGKLILKDSMAVCPMHEWKLNLNTLQYNNSHECKRKLDYVLDDSETIHIEDADNHLVNPYKSNKKGAVNLRWLNHATVHVECNGVTLITDPWLFGPAFMTGWWLATPSPKEGIELLKNADYVYVSHNHPDHLHAETLALLPKDKKIIIPDFKSKSCEKYLRKLHFTNITPLNFNDIFEIGPNIQVSILKSGDFRDDSGLYVCANGHEFLFAVDCNFLNHHVLPQNIDLLLTAFAGGASGFPLCFDNYTEAEKEAILHRNTSAVKLSVINYLKATYPRYYLPYAGMFKEKSSRDAFILSNNKKNSPQHFESVAEKFGAGFIAPCSNQIVSFTDGILSIREVETELLNEEDFNFYITTLKAEFSYEPGKIIDYLANSGFVDNQIVQIIPTDDNFDQIVGEIVYADFKKQEFKTITRDALTEHKEGYRVMQLKVRPEVFMCVITNSLPWEDFSIGFQMRIKRSPNEYESKFWYHFTNIYIGKENFRYSSFCGACTVVNQNPIWATSYPSILS